MLPPPNLRPVNTTCNDIPDPPTTDHDQQSRKAWHDWLTTYVNWNKPLSIRSKQPTMVIKNIQIVRTHTWTTSHPQYNPSHHHTVRYLYHGTPSRNIDSITTEGFRASAQKTWLAVNPAYSVSYCIKEDPYRYNYCGSITGKLILCSVLIQKGVDEFNGGDGCDGTVAVMKSAKRIVPIAVIEFEQTGYQG
ncbi:hypothetical protein HDV00_001970 [Rhizophlyctis rosea]|nr:hypothetical protein HDV00_001970 [Rhizophlyctis rosea]